MAIWEKNVANNVDVSCLKAPRQNGPYKKIKNKHLEQHEIGRTTRCDRQLEYIMFCVFSPIFIYILYLFK